MTSHITHEKFRPSGMGTALDCKRQYLLKRNSPPEYQPTWVEAQAMVKPVEPKKPTAAQLRAVADAASARAITAAYKLEHDAYKSALKAYNRVYRPALGTEVHARLEAYMQGSDVVNFEDVPGRVALVMLQHVPPRDACAVIECEAPSAVPAYIAGERDAVADGIVLEGTRDLSVQVPQTWDAHALKLDNGWLLIDYKTTYTFDFIDWEKTIKTVKTVEQLREDGQVNIYGLAVMVEHDLQELRCRWVYGRTEGDPAAVAVEFTITRAHAERVVGALVILARELRGYMREKKNPLDVEGNASACPKYGGCIYHIDKGGPCTPPKIDPAARLLQLRNQRKNTMASFRDKAKAASEGNSNAENTNTTADTGSVDNGTVPIADNQDSGTEAGSTDVAGDQATERAAAPAPRVSAPAPRAKSQKPAEGTQASIIAALAVELAAADKARDGVLARLREVVGA